MGTFEARVAAFRGEFLVSGDVAGVFPLFSPGGEEAWVPGWAWRPLHPRDGRWQRGQLFCTDEEHGEAVWIVTRHDPEAGAVEYHRVEPGRYVARITVLCETASEARVRVRTEYEYTGLSEAGNAEIGSMSSDAYAAKMERWRSWIASLRRGAAPSA